MEKPIIEKPRVRDLIKIGISAGHASEMLRGLKSPSLEMARRIEVATGYPISAWPAKDAGK